MLFFVACKNQESANTKTQAEEEKKIECNSIFEVVHGCSQDELEAWLLRDSTYANQRDTTKYQKTILMYAAEINDSSKFNLLLQHGADPFALVNKYIYPQYDVLYVALKNDADNVLKTIINQKLFDLNKRYSDCESPIYTCARENSPKTMKLLIENGANIHVIDECQGVKGHSPLAWAAMERSYDACKVLIENGADVNRIEDNMHSVLGITCLTYENEGSFDIIKLLVENGADVNQANDLNFTPLMMCAFIDNVKCIEFLVKNGAELNAMTSSGYTALHYATNNDKIETAELLLKLGADPNIRDNQGNLAIDLLSNQELKRQFLALIK